MKGEILYKILNLLEDTVLDFADFQATILTSRYGSSLGRLEYNLRKRQQVTDKYRLEREKNQESKIRLQRYISKLKKDGLLLQNGLKISITKDGIEKLNFLRGHLVKEWPKEKSPNLLIISYDFPVKWRRARDRFREILKLLDFKMIHQSVWVGKTKIPEELLKYLEKTGTLKYTEILEVTKEGTIRKQ